MHVLPNGHAVYCAWNTDNGGPQSVGSVQSTYSNLRRQYPHAKVFASTFEDFYLAASSDPAVMTQLPVVTQEIGDTYVESSYVGSIAPSSPTNSSRLGGQSAWNRI